MRHPRIPRALKRSEKSFFSDPDGGRACPGAVGGLRFRTRLGRCQNCSRGERSRDFFPIPLPEHSILEAGQGSEGALQAKAGAL